MNDFNILSRVLVTETGFGLVIGFIIHSQVVTTIITLFLIYTIYNRPTIIFSVYFQLSSLSVTWQRISTQELSQTHTSNITAPSLSQLQLIERCRYFYTLWFTVTHNSPLLVTQLKHRN
jgi:hypothetical protein